MKVRHVTQAWTGREALEQRLNSCECFLLEQHEAAVSFYSESAGSGTQHCTEPASEPPVFLPAGGVWDVRDRQAET